MSRKLDIACALSVALTLGFTLFNAEGSGAAAESRNPQGRTPHLAQQITAQPVAGSEVAIAAEIETPETWLPTVNPAPTLSTAPDAPADVLARPLRDGAVTLAALVADQDTSGALSRELECLAGAIYFEAKSETLAGQLAVGRVIINRARSGRFANSYCGVVFQRSQFSFVRGNAMPAINRTSHGWKTASAIAQIANEGTWSSPVEGALFFHAARVSPNWRLTRIARVDNHVFYR